MSTPTLLSSRAREKSFFVFQIRLKKKNEKTWLL